MHTSTRIMTANDNQPLRAYPIAVNTRFAGTPRPAPREFVSQISTAMPAGNHNTPLPKAQVLTTAKYLWLAAIVFAALTLLIPALPPVQIIAGLALLGTSLFTLHHARIANHSKLTELSAFTGMLGLAGTLASALSLSGTALNMSDLMGILSVTALGFAGFSRSHLALMTSCIASLVWVGYTFAGVSSPSIFFFAFPAIWSMQIYLASRIKSRLAIIAGNLSGYYWLIGHALSFMAAGTISPVMAFSGLFITGIVHYRGGKAAEDESAFGHETHTYFGWVMAMIGAITIAHYWLFPDNILWQNMKATSMGMLGWKLTIALGIAAVYLSMMVRWKHYRVTSRGAIVTTILCALIPATLWWESAVRSFGDSILGIPASPTIGLIIAAGVLATALGVALNGVRRNRLKMVLCGMFAACAQGLILMNPALFTLENVLIFGVSLLIAFAIGATLASESLSYTKREPQAYSPPPALAA